MSLLVGSSPAAHTETIERRHNIVPITLPREGDRQEVVAWAIATVGEAEQRMAGLMARIEYLESLSVTDELTGLLNRRGFLAQLDRTLATARRGGPQGVLMICDLDGFKAVNDRYGHLVGDEVLCQIAALLGRHVRRSDVVARLGGDEFAILLGGAQLASARRKAQALAHLVATAGFRGSAGEVRLRVSFGLAAYCGTESEAELMKRADLAMYGQKRRHGAARPHS